MVEYVGVWSIEKQWDASSPNGKQSFSGCGKCQSSRLLEVKALRSLTVCVRSFLRNSGLMSGDHFFIFKTNVFLLFYSQTAISFHGTFRFLNTRIIE
jgi:hypothetical protein